MVQVGRRQPPKNQRLSTPKHQALNTEHYLDRGAVLIERPRFAVWGGRMNLRKQVGPR